MIKQEEPKFIKFIGTALYEKQDDDKYFNISIPKCSIKLQKCGTASINATCQNQVKRCLSKLQKQFQNRMKYKLIKKRPYILKSVSEANLGFKIDTEKLVAQHPNVIKGSKSKIRATYKFEQFKVFTDIFCNGKVKFQGVKFNEHKLAFEKLKQEMRDYKKE